LILPFGRGDKVRGDKVRGDKARGDKVKGDKVKGDRARGDKALVSVTSQDRKINFKIGFFMSCLVAVMQVFFLTE